MSMTRANKRPLRLMSMLSGTGMGGADILALDFSIRLHRMGHHVIFCCPPDNILIKKAEEAGLEIKPLEQKRQGVTDIGSLRDFIRYCAGKKIDIVNSHHSMGRHFLSAARLLGLRSKSKIVFTRHCLRGGVPFTGFFDNLTSDLNIAVSNHVRRSFLLGGMLPGNIVTVHGGVDIEKFENVPEEKIEEARKKYIHPGAFNIGIVGRFHETEPFLKQGKPSMKRHEVLFRALATIKEYGFNLLVIGPSDPRSLEIMKKLAGLCGLNESALTLCGFQEDVAPFYKIMDLNVLPSPREGLGLAVVEAMAAGAPTVGAGSGGIKEIITDGVDGFLFRPGSSDDLARKIKLLLGNAGLRISFAQKGRRKAGELFDIEKNSKKLEEVFYRVAGLRF